MGPLTGKIYDIKISKLAAGISANGSALHEPFAFIVKWKSGYTGKCYQIYVNGELYEKVTDPYQRSAVVTYDSLFSTAVRVLVCAVEPQKVDYDFSSKFDSIDATGQVHISWARGLYLPYKGRAEVFSNNGSGEVCYDLPACKAIMPLWPIWQDQCGWGMSKFGRSDFGYDSSAAVGFGQGAFGYGEHGFDAVKQEWSSEKLSKGRYKYSIKVYDNNGNAATSFETSQLVMIDSPGLCEKLAIESYDKTRNEIVFKFN